MAVAPPDTLQAPGTIQVPAALLAALTEGLGAENVGRSGTSFRLGGWIF